jgi:hypothetical protein
MEENIFKKMEEEGIGAEEINNPAPIQSNSNEVDYDKLSDKALGENKKYVRENLDGKEVVIQKAQLFNADTSTDPILGLKDKTKKYYKCNFIITYDLKNKDDLFHREYLSGIIQLVQKDGSLSPHVFWYEGADNQVSSLWEEVAKFKKVDPKELSPREFMGFLNSKPKAILKFAKIKFQGDIHNKNLVEKFI